MYGGRGNSEIALHVGLGRRPAIDARIGIDEGEVLALLFGEVATRRRMTHAADPVHSGLEPREAAMNLRYRVELSEAERNELTALLRGGPGAPRPPHPPHTLSAAGA